MAPRPPTDRRRLFLAALALAALAVGLPLAALAVAWGFGLAQRMGDAADAREALCRAPAIDDGSLRAEEIDLRRMIAEREREHAARLAQCRPPPPPEPEPPPPEPPPPEPPPPEPPPPPPPPRADPPRRPADAQACDVTTRSGGRGVTTTRHYLGPTPGRVTITYDMLREPDHLQVFHGNRLLAETSGLVRGRGTVSFDWNPPPGARAEALVVRVVVTGTPGSSSTRWSYGLGCPGGPPGGGARGR